MNRPYPWKCSKCRERLVYPVTVNYSTELEHDGRVYKVAVNGLEVLRCENCGTEIVPDESYQKLTDALRRQAGLLMPAEITAKREALGLKQKELAQYLSVAPETVSRWETGGQIQQRAMNVLLRAFFEVPELREHLRRSHGLPSVKRQGGPARRQDAQTSEATSVQMVSTSGFAGTHHAKVRFNVTQARDLVKA
jgi:putative zinc finger/helix-turn-helix YgiT family protein